MKIFWKAQILEMAESDTLCVKSGDNHDFANGTWLRSVYPSYKNIFVKKLPSKLCSKELPSMYFLGGDCAPTATARSLKLT